MVSSALLAVEDPIYTESDKNKVKFPFIISVYKLNIYNFVHRFCKSLIIYLRQYSRQNYC